MTQAGACLHVNALSCMIMQMADLLIPAETGSLSRGGSRR